MRSAEKFHPEWGYLSPAPSFIRSVRIALASTAIGATSAAAVVFSLVGQLGSSNDNASLVARALVSKAPVIVSAAGATPLANSTAAAAPANGSTQPKPPVACVAPLAPEAASALASAHEPSKPTEKAAVAETHPAPAAKAVARKRSWPRKAHWQQTTVNPRPYRRYDQEFRPSYQVRDNRSFGQVGYSGAPNDW